MWMMARRFFFDRRTKEHNSLLFANPVAVPRLPDAIYLIRLFSHGFKNPRLFAFGLASFRRLFLITRLSKPSGRREMNSRRAFKPPGWIRTLHTMASGRRGLSSLWNMEVSIIKVVWKTGNLNSWRAFKPPGWNQTQHIMASGRRGFSSPWNMEVSIIKVVWKTGT